MLRESPSGMAATVSSEVCTKMSENRTQDGRFKCQFEITALVRVDVLTVKSHDNLHSKKKHVVSRVCALVQDRTK